MEENYQGCLTVAGIIGIIILVVILVLGGTFRTEVVFSPQAVDELGVQTTFTESFTSHHFLFGLVKGKQPDVQGAMAKYIEQGKQISQIKIQTRHTFVNSLLTGITIGIYSPVKINVFIKITQSAEEKN